jgi:hypothetical protein
MSFHELASMVMRVASVTALLLPTEKRLSGRRAPPAARGNGSRRRSAPAAC